MKQKEKKNDYKKVNKVYKLSQSGKLLVDRIRKTRLKVTIFAVVVFFIALIGVFQLMFSENWILKNGNKLNSEVLSAVDESTETTTALTEHGTDNSESQETIESSPSSVSFLETSRKDDQLTNEESPISITISNNTEKTETKAEVAGVNFAEDSKNEKVKETVIESDKEETIVDTETEEENQERKDEADDQQVENQNSSNKYASNSQKYSFVVAFGVSVFDNPKSLNVIDQLRYATYVTKIDETVENSVSYSKISYKTSKGTVEGWVRSQFLSDSLKPITGEEYKEFSFEPVKKISARISNVRGIYLTRSSVSNREKIAKWVSFSKATNLNAFVIDVKDDEGFMLFKTNAAAKFVPNANDKAYYTKDEFKVIANELKEKGFYLIARIVCFKDPSYARAHLDRAIVYKDTGAPYMGVYKVPWASAYDRQLWEYNVEVAKEAVEVGFDEIQYDYVRFPEIRKEERDKLNLRKPGNETFAEAIQKFLIYSKKELAQYNIPLAADIFGLVSTAVDDVGIGQYWEAVTNVVDYVCPMVYPSHYANGSFGLSVPDAYPYETIYRALSDGIRRNNHVPTPAKIRPWLQSFTATWVKGHIVYDENAIRKQIKAAKDLGINEYMLWNASNNYKNMWYD
ncbi:MAG: putative glycoside hydrolase [Fervidobacterium sp.]|uniref:putative glycoside hydrolase n=1 Tax=Fervidobacterium sp. TaxID=1871331 RepID=UPI004048ED37